MSSPSNYSIPNEAEQVLKTGILQNPLINKYIPKDAAEEVQNVHFSGHQLPSLPINWRFAESVSALKGYQAVLVNTLLKRKYGVQPAKVEINTDHAQLFFMSVILWAIDPNGKNLNAWALTGRGDPASTEAIAKMFPSWDLHKSQSSPYRVVATNIYQCKDGKYFHVHGSMNPDHTLKALDLPTEDPASDFGQAMKPLIQRCSELTSDEVFQKAIIEARQAGTYCLTPDQFRGSEQGKANEHVGLFEIHHVPSEKQRPCWWPTAALTSAKRPLAGLKVVDLTRIIAAPSITRELAELGASVMRVTAPHQPDMSVLHPDLNQGKWTTLLDLREETDRQHLRELVLDADVVVQGYRPGVLEKYGFGRDDILELCKHRERGIIYARENCFGWNGPDQDRIGWQQVSDANCGVSYGFGRAMGLDEPVTPVFPNSDFCTGIAGACGIVTALLQRAEQGGSYVVDIALNYYSRWLIDHVGEYPADIWQDVWKRNGQPVLHHFQGMHESLSIFMQMIMKNSASVLMRPDFFHEYSLRHLGTSIKAVAPVLRFPEGTTQPGFQVGTRGNGIDKPFWPQDLTVEVVA